MRKTVRIYVLYDIEDPDGTMTDEEAIQKAYDKVDEDIDHGWFALTGRKLLVQMRR